MTHAGLLALLFAGVDKQDPRVQAAWQWILDNYTLEENPGSSDKSGLFITTTCLARVCTPWAK